MICAFASVPVCVQPEADHCLRLRFENGEERIFDVSPYLEDSYFSQLRSPAVFSTMRVNCLTGEWMGGIDICPDMLHENSRSAE